MGSIELQVFIALGVVLAAVLIALAVDFLKGSNERLRERNAALVEREKAAGERAFQVERLHHQMVELVEALKDAEQMQPVAVSAPMVRPKSSSFPEPAVGEPAPARLIIPDARLAVVTETPMPESAVEVRVVRDESLLVTEDEVIEELPPSADLVGSGWGAPEYGNRKTRRFVGEPESAVWGLEEGPLMPASGILAEAPPWQDWIQAIEAQVESIEPRAEEVVEESVEAVAPASVGPIESKVVEMPRTPVAPQHGDELDNQAIPGGVHPPSVLSELLLSEETFFGVTLSISVVDYVRLTAENGKEAVEQVMSALETLVQASGSPADLVCRISEDEFIVVCPGATGAVATSRVQLLSENLWDFQLRSLVSFAILFSWGASESGLMPNMPRILADSVDRAREQMLESRRSRRALTWASAKYGLQSSAG